jgi:L-amino acid N-acyltransferase YncA
VTARIEPMTGEHAVAVLAIYQEGIDKGNATFETRAPAWDKFTAARLPGHRYVALTAGDVAGWVAVFRPSSGSVASASAKQRTPPCAPSCMMINGASPAFDTFSTVKP